MHHSYFKMGHKIAFYDQYKIFLLISSQCDDLTPLKTKYTRKMIICHPQKYSAEPITFLLFRKNFIPHYILMKTEKSISSVHKRPRNLLGYRRRHYSHLQNQSSESKCRLSPGMTTLCNSDISRFNGRQPSCGISK